MDVLSDATKYYRKDLALKYLQKLFRNYYINNPPPPPNKLEKREWGFFSFDKGMMRRHLQFCTPEDLENFYSYSVPRHAYYSTALYKDSGLRRMDEKGWEGAELIFDLDADHIEGAEEMGYEEQLGEVKIEVLKLLHKYILGILGFDRKYVSVTFSGGRGYHIHVKDPRVLQLSSKERREIVDFITGTGLDMERIFPRTSLTNKPLKKHKKMDYIRGMPQKGDVGWKGIIGDGITNLVERLDNAGQEKAIKWMNQLVKNHNLKDDNGKYFGKATVEKTHEELFSGVEGKRGCDKIKNGIFEAFSKNRHRDFFIELLKAETMVRLAGETDEPVTIDTHRLIRAPGTLHGKTGFRVVQIPINELENFRPLHEAVVLPEEKMKVECLENTRFSLKGKPYAFEVGIHEMETYAAAFLIARDQAVLPRRTYNRKQ